jgi:hypothetical protein
MDDLHAALAAERSSTFLTQARYDGLVRVARCCTPRGIANGIARARDVGSRALHWLRAGQLAGYPGQACCG